MALIPSWGKCRLVTRKRVTSGTNTNKWVEWKTPVQNSTAVDTTKGDKKELKIEGGENEAVRYDKNTYALNTSIRIGAGDKKPLPDKDGTIEGDYEVAVIPENINAPGIYIESANVSVVPVFGTEEGVQLDYTFEAQAAASGDQVKFGVFTLTETKAGDISTATAFKITPVGNAEDSTTPSAINLIGA